VRTSHVRRIVALSLTSVLALPLVACTGPDTPAPDAAAEKLVQGLTKGSITNLPVRKDTSADPDEQLASIVTPLLEATGLKEPQVRKVKVVQIEDRAAGEDVLPTATLTMEWSWPLGGDAVWSYLTQTDLVYYAPEEGSEDEEGFWQARFAPDVVVPDLQPGERISVEAIQPPRAGILDGVGEPLVTERDIYRVGIDKTLVSPESWTPAATDLATFVGASGVRGGIDGREGREGGTQGLCRAAHHQDGRDTADRGRRARWRPRHARHRAAGPDVDVRAGHPRPGRRADRRDDRGVRRAPQGGRRHRHQRAPEGVRRPARRLARDRSHR